MTAMQKAMNAYGQAVDTIPPARQIVMLYEGVLRHIAHARTAIANRRINDRFMAVQKATLILEALQGCLDHDKGGEIAPQLDRLYTHYIFRLQAINIEDDPAICDELIGMIGELRDSWATLAKSGTSPAAHAAPSNRMPAPAPITA
ncbi:MAG: flagellar export chaperone FliS [Rhizobiales bacterium]|nr:flagellar export chaperone FliS [Hyphomicrobiales bacterium]